MFKMTTRAKQGSVFNFVTGGDTNWEDWGCTIISSITVITKDISVMQGHICTIPALQHTHGAKLVNKVKEFK